MKNTFQVLIISLIWSLSACKPAESINSLDKALFATQDSTTFIIKGYRPQTGNTLQNLFVSNFSVKVSSGELLLMTARDGLPDITKTALQPTYGFLTISPESAVLGFADLLLFEAGITLGEQPLMNCSASRMNSTSSDALIYNDTRYVGNPVTFIGLRDCDKVYMGLDPSKFDYNGNGIPDYLEMRCGMNPLNHNQASASTAGDGVSDIDKCKKHIPIDEAADYQPNQAFSYNYNTVRNVNGSFDLTISNIGILNKGADNMVAMYITETNSATNATSLYTAFAILKSGYDQKSLQFNYWATAPALYTNQEILVP